jgi:sugar (pentulose or hexulose) kinase
VTVTAMRACGGPARSDAWNQVKADVTGFPILVPDVLETAVLGSAILGAVAIGANSDVGSAIRAMTRIDHRLEPRPEHAETYDRLFAAYTGLYPAVVPVMRPLTAASPAVHADAPADAVTRR